MKSIENGISELCGDIKRAASGSAEICLLKVKALSADRELQKRLIRLGKLYYKSAAQGAELTEELSRAVAAVAEGVEELESLKDEIASKEGGTVCSDCGALNLRAAARCSRCDSEL